MPVNLRKGLIRRCRFEEQMFFRNIQEALFRERVNRFIVTCTVNNRVVTAYLPNPGRLWELLFPGRKLYLVKNALSPTRETSYTVVAVEREGIFDRSIAMFPDAVTLRGSRHVRELAELSKKGDLRGGILFVVHWPYARFFIPEYHTDLVFANNLYTLKNNLFIRAMAVGWEKGLSLSSVVRMLEIPWDLIEREAQDRGSYIVILYLREDTRLSVGNFGGAMFRKGYYLYVGSAMNNLTKRIERHRRKRKRMFWHIDYLREKAEFCNALPIRSTTSLECSIAKVLKSITDWSIQGFGSSDCSCDTHLFGMYQNPVHLPAFIETLLYFRLGRLEEELIYLCYTNQRP